MLGMSNKKGRGGGSDIYMYVGHNLATNGIHIQERAVQTDETTEKNPPLDFKTFCTKSYRIQKVYYFHFKKSWFFGGGGEVRGRCVFCLRSGCARVVLRSRPITTLQSHFPSSKHNTKLTKTSPGRQSIGGGGWGGRDHSPVCVCMWHVYI